jgi:hypothetical protein
MKCPWVLDPGYQGTFHIDAPEIHVQMHPLLKIPIAKGNLDGYGRKRD